MRRTLVTVALLVFAALISPAFCRRPPPSPWPADEEWIPEPDRPDSPRIFVYGGYYPIEPDTPFYLFYRWAVLPTNQAYDYWTGDPEQAYMNLQDHTDNANCRYMVWIDDTPLDSILTIDGRPVEQFSYKGRCGWWRFWNSELPRPDFPDEPYFPDRYWAVAPMAIVCEYYIVFPDGLPQSDHRVFLRGEISGGEPFERMTELHIGHYDGYFLPTPVEPGTEPFMEIEVGSTEYAELRFHQIFPVSPAEAWVTFEYDSDPCIQASFWIDSTEYIWPVTLSVPPGPDMITAEIRITATEAAVPDTTYEISITARSTVNGEEEVYVYPMWVTVIEPP